MKAYHGRQGRVLQAPGVHPQVAKTICGKNTTAPASRIARSPKPLDNLGDPLCESAAGAGCDQQVFRAIDLRRQAVSGLRLRGRTVTEQGNLTGEGLVAKLLYPN